ncbi:hypothetical protein ACFFIS_03085 [Virgibacillus soli]|uniref:hypothetical protein n=1 Tax=Paracerasibacillus soli TaxID=480284 RepID=UPI0035EEC2ED
MKSSTVLKWISGGLEAFWGFPIIGGTFVIGLAYTPLMLMFILHIITLIFSLIQDKKSAWKYTWNHYIRNCLDSNIRYAYAYFDCGVSND